MEIIFLQTGVFGEVAGQFIQKLFSGVLWFGLAALIIGILSWLMWYFLVYKKKFDIEVKIVSERAEDKNRIIFDNAAILTDRKTGSKYFKLWHTKVELPSPKFNILQSSSRGDFLELYRTGEDIIYFLTPPRINKKYVIKSDGKIYAVADTSVKMIDPDMGYWAAKRKGQNKGMFDPEKVWMKILPYVPHIVAGVLVIFIIWILMNTLPEILQNLKVLSETLAQQQRVQTITGG